MSKIEWEPVDEKLKSKEDFFILINYAEKFFNTKNLLLISEYYNSNVYRIYNFNTYNLEKHILDNHFGTKYSFRHKDKIILHTYDKILGGIFWRKY